MGSRVQGVGCGVEGVWCKGGASSDLRDAVGGDDRVLEGILFSGCFGFSIQTICIHDLHHVYAYIHTYIHTYIHAYIHTYIHTYVHTHI